MNRIFNKEEGQTRCIHDLVLGCTFAYRIHYDTLYVVASFCSKSGPNYPRPTARKPDNYSRKVGRKICDQRIRHAISSRIHGQLVPYMTIINLNKIQGMEDAKYVNSFLEKRIEGTIHGCLDIIRNIHPEYSYRKAKSLEQLDNSSIVNTVSEGLMELVKNLSGMGRVKKVLDEAKTQS